MSSPKPTEIEARTPGVISRGRLPQYTDRPCWVGLGLGLGFELGLGLGSGLGLGCRGEDLMALCDHEVVDGRHLRRAVFHLEHAAP